MSISHEILHSFITNLKQSYLEFPWYKRLLFPRAIVLALENYDIDQPETFLAVCHALIKNNYFFHRWFFSNLCLPWVIDQLAYLNTLPAHITSFGLGYKHSFFIHFIDSDDVWNFSFDDLKIIFEALPTHISSIELSGVPTKFNRIIRNMNLTMLFNALPKNLSSIRFSYYFFENKTGAELAIAFRALPAHLTSIDFTYCWSSDNPITSTELAVAFSALPPNLESIDLSYNKLDGLALGALPIGLISINLHRCFNGHPATGLQIAAILGSIRARLSSIYLSGNDLGRLTGNELSAVFSAIPASVTSIDLSGNNLTIIDSQLAIALGALPNKITSIDISGTNFDDYPESKKILFNSDSIISIRITEFTNDKYLIKTKLLTKLLMQLVENLVSTKENSLCTIISPPIEIDKVILEKIIENLKQEKERPDLANLICGLLLDGRIKNSEASAKEGLESRNETMTLKAVQFYLKVVNSQNGTQATRDFANFILWHHKATEEFDSVVALLTNSSEVEKPAYLLTTYNFFEPKIEASSNLRFKDSHEALQSHQDQSLNWPH